MEKRALLALALSIVVIFLYQLLVVKTSDQKPGRAVREGNVSPVPREATIEPKAIPEKREDRVVAEAPFSVESEASPKEARQCTVETAYARLVLDNQGGQVKAIYLTEYPDKKGRPVNLMPSRGEGSYALYLKSEYPELDRLVNHSVYDVSCDHLKLDSRNPRGTITFSHEARSGLKVRKTFEFQHRSYSFSVKVSLEGLPSEKPVKVYQWLWRSSRSADASPDVEPHYEGPLLLLNKKITKDMGKHYGNVSWIALNSKYFLVAFLPQQAFSTAVAEGNDGQLAVGLEFVGNSPSIFQELKLYTGPKETDALRQTDISLEQAIDYGWVGFLARPLLWFLHQLFQLTGNYGLSIILLTVLIKIVFFPLSHKSFKSMQGMKELQPRIKDLQEKFKGEKQKLNQEMFNLYRERKVNPFGGCLPMVLQIPVFFALYRVLLDAIEMRNAHFWWWITDLSSKDPYYVYPILMGASMVIQQKMSPPVGDPMQNRMMMFMPLIFTVMFLNFPVGLVIYWLVNNVLTIAQQYFTMNMVAAAPRAGEAVKKRVAS